MPIDADQPSWFDLTVAFHKMRSRALNDEPFDVTTDDLTIPWRWFREQPHLIVLRQSGALSSALVLRRMGYVDLANRFAVWLLRDAEASPMESLADSLTGVGLPTAPVEFLGDLDSLVDEMIAILRESEAATHAEDPAVEVGLIREHRSEGGAGDSVVGVG